MALSIDTELLIFPEEQSQILIIWLYFIESVSGIDFRRCIFVFLSNTGGREITEIAYKFWKEGKTRESISYVDLENLIRNGAFNEKGGLHKSNVVERHLVDFYVPFLPLERIHVKQCIEFQIQKAVNETLTVSNNYTNNSGCNY